ncbi:MAG: dienelactone hydrolase family protein [Pseudomonadales bacterium]
MSRTSFAQQHIVFANGSEGEHVLVPSASPSNYHQVLNDRDDMPAVNIDGKLFLPVGAADVKARVPCVIVVPGSLGIAESHLAHAETLTNLGIAAFVLDPFGPRSVTSTVANQTQYSFAASALDVLAAVRVLANDPRIDPHRVGAQGHSRGGSAVMTAATTRFAHAVLEGAPPLHAVLAAYPWCGHQFLDPRVGATRIRVLIGDHDAWCLPQQAQGHVHAIRLTGGDASIKLFSGAAHSFDRGTAITNVRDASVSPGAPTVYIDDQGAMIHPVTGAADPRSVDRDFMVYALKAGYGVRGAVIGSNPGEAAAFHEAMSAFWVSALLS